MQANINMKILVTGVKGQLGYDAVKELNRRGIDCRGVDVEDFDLTDSVAVAEYIRNYAPDAVMHCAAYTAVDNAEDNRELCFAVNARGTENIARVCKEIGAKLLYISTDYVFDGRGNAPFETGDPVEPLNVYGASKLAGERAVMDICDKFFIVRTSWVFGINGKNFVRTMLRLGHERRELSVVDDQTGSPTYTFDLARLIADMIITEKYGVYHATNEGFCSWHGFAREIFKKAGLHVRVNPVSSDTMSFKARRPENSRLSKRTLADNGFEPLPPWQDALNRYLAEIFEKTIDKDSLR